MAPGLPVTSVGIRPGEKIHEMMINQEDSLRTYDLGDYYLITPFHYDKVRLPKSAKRVDPNFEYHSGNNSWWLDIKTIKKNIAHI